MTILILAIIFGLMFTFFSIQNTSGVTIQFANYIIPNVPLYLVAIGALLLGLIIAGVFNLADNLTAFFNIQGKKQKIQQKDSQLEILQNKIHELELENIRLKSTNHSETAIVETREETTTQPTQKHQTKQSALVERLKQQFSY